LCGSTGIPVTMTLMGLGAFPADDPLSLDMLGMHGSVYANWAVRDCDLLLAFGVRFDDRVTGKLEAFAKHAKIVHIDIDPSELNKNKPAHIPIVGEIRHAFRELNQYVEPKPEIADWVEQVQQWKRDYPFKYNQDFDGILQQHAIQVLSELTADRDTIVSSASVSTRCGAPSSSSSSILGVGSPVPGWDHGVRAAGGDGAQAAHPDALVIDIDGDGSFQMNIQELATCYCENLPVKVLLLNNQHLGMVVQWEDRFMAGNRAHTYLGPIHHAEAKGRGDDIYASERYPDFVQIAKGYGCGAATVRRREDLREALRANDRVRRAVCVGRADAVSRARVAHDPVESFGGRHDHGIGLHRLPHRRRR
jgi:acetolactate synthase I/II/III large subunit